MKDPNELKELKVLAFKYVKYQIVVKGELIVSSKLAC